MVIPFPRLWLERKQQGSIVITSSMSSRIINKAAEAVPLAQVIWSLVFRSSLNTRHVRFSTTPRKPLFRTSPKGLPPNGLLKGFVSTPCLLVMVRNSSFSWRQRKSDSAALVNTDQTSHMEKKIREFQAKSLPLGRFAEVNVPYNSQTIIVSKTGIR